MESRTRAAPMRCPTCGSEMNHHADKVDFGAALESPEAGDPVLGGVLQEIHQCPNPTCGRIATKRAPST